MSITTTPAITRIVVTPTRSCRGSDGAGEEQDDAERGQRGREQRLPGALAAGDGHGRHEAAQPHPVNHSESFTAGRKYVPATPAKRQTIRDSAHAPSGNAKRSTMPRASIPEVRAARGAASATVGCSEVRRRRVVAVTGPPVTVESSDAPGGPDTSGD